MYTIIIVKPKYKKIIEHNERLLIYSFSFIRKQNCLGNNNKVLRIVPSLILKGIKNFNFKSVFPCYKLLSLLDISSGHSDKKCAYVTTPLMTVCTLNFIYLCQYVLLVSVISAMKSVSCSEKKMLTSNALIKYSKVVKSLQSKTDDVLLNFIE